MCHCLSWRYLDFQSIMGRTCHTTLTTSTISEHGQMLICYEQHQVFGVCNWLCRHSCQPRKSTNLEILAHSSKHSWTKKFSWFGEFYRRFILGFSHIAWPLNHLTKGNGKTIFKWTPTQQQAFEQLKNNLLTVHVLVLPDLHWPFEIEKNTSDYALGVVITQLGHPFVFHFETFNDDIRRYSTYEKEMYAIVQALKKWRQ